MMQCEPPLWCCAVVWRGAPGKIVVYTGLLRLLKGEPPLVATVMGHEVAHALARHGTEKVRGGVPPTRVLFCLGGGMCRYMHNGRRRVCMRGAMPGDEPWA